jgi:hypothetical protein
MRAQKDEVLDVAFSDRCFPLLEPLFPNIGTENALHRKKELKTASHRHALKNGHRWYGSVVFEWPTKEYVSSRKNKPNART